MSVTSPYKIRQVDPWDDDEARDTIVWLHDVTSDFPTIAPEDFETGHWWLVADPDGLPIAYAGLIKSDRYPLAGYFKRVGVLAGHRGHGLQRRLMRAIERRARRVGWNLLVSDTTENVHSANNFVRTGWTMFEPAWPWAFEHSIYWRKELR